MDCEYREFYTREEAELWAEQYYGDILGLARDSRLYHEISTYTGSWYKATNQVLRAMPPYGTPQYGAVNTNGQETVLETITIIADALNAHSLPENIIAYRYLHLKDMFKMCGTLFLRRGITFADKAFVSTGIVKGQLEKFRKENSCTCLLKLYLPKGTTGAYVSFEEDRHLLNEQEFLLPPCIHFKILKVNLFSFPLMIECIALPS